MEKNQKKDKKWLKILLIIMILPLYILYKVFQKIWKSDWSKKKKIVMTLVIVGILFTGGIMSGVEEAQENQEKAKNSNSQQTEVQEEKTIKEKIKEKVDEKDKEPEKDVFSKEDALKILKSYKLKEPMETPHIPEGKTILEVYEIRGSAPAITNLGWFAEKEKEKEGFIVGYKEAVGNNNLPSNPRWQITEKRIKALNGIALGITPELKEWKKIEGDSDFSEKAIQKQDSNDQETVEELREILKETNALFQELNEKYQTAKNQGKEEFGIEEAREFNIKRRELQEKTKDYVYNRKDKYRDIKRSLSIAVADLHTLYREYESDLKGEENDISYFKNNIQDGLQQAEEHLKNLE
jgi:hypothetical protein